MRVIAAILVGFQCAVRYWRSLSSEAASKDIFVVRLQRFGVPQTIFLYAHGRDAWQVYSVLNELGKRQE